MNKANTMPGRPHYHFVDLKWKKVCYNVCQRQNPIYLTYYFCEIVTLINNLGSLMHPPLPSFFVFLHRKHYRSHTMTEKRKSFLKINDMKTYGWLFFWGYFEIKPISKSFCIYIMLQNQVKMPSLIALNIIHNRTRQQLLRLECIHKISALKMTIKHDILLRYFHFLLILTKIVRIYRF